MHLSKPDWNLEEGLMLCKNLLTEAATSQVWAAAGGSTEDDGELLRSNYVKYSLYRKKLA